MTAADSQTITPVGHLTDHELDELRVRLNLIASIEEDIERLSLTRAVATNERMLYTRSVFKRLGLAENATFRIDTESGAVYPSEDQS